MNRNRLRLKKRNLREIIYLFGYGCILLAFLLSVSQAPNQYVFLYSCMRYLRIIGYGCCILKVVLQGKMSFQHIVFIGVVSCFTIIATMTTDSIIIMNDILVLVTCEGIEIDRIIKADIYIKAVYGLFTILIFFAGIVSDVMEYRGGVLSRHSWGFAHPNRFALHAFSICIYLIYLNRSKIKWKHILFIISLGLLTLYVTDGRTSLIGIFFTVLLAVILKITQKNKQKQEKLLNMITVPVAYSSLIGSVLVSFIVPILYLHGKVHLDLSSTVASRFSQSAKALSNYGISAFGQHIDFITSGVARKLGLEANGIDNMYVYLGVNFGAIVMTLILILIFLGLKYSIKINDYVGAICFSMVIVMGVLENQFLSIESNLFLFYIGYYWYDTYRKRESKRISISSSRNMRINKK